MNVETVAKIGSEQSSRGAATVENQLARGSRVQQVDVLRGVAILLVLWHHDAMFSISPGIFAPLRTFGERFGWTGVDLFFVLSGFLIGGLLFREILATGRLHVFRFLCRRAFKIWPGYFALLAFAIVHLTARGYPLRETFGHFIPYFFQVQNYSSVLNSKPWAISLTWSLAVEEHFYLVLPTGLALLALRGRDAVARLFLPWACFSIGIIALNRSVHGIFSPYESSTHYFPTHLRLDALLLGVICAHASVFHSRIWARMIRGGSWWLLLGLGLLLPMSLIQRENLFVHTAGYTLSYLGYGCLLLAVLAVEPKVGIAGKVLSSPVGRAVSTIGFYSYAIYLWHLNLAAYPIEDHLRLIRSYLPPSLAWLVTSAIFFVTAVVVGVAMTLLIEAPALRLRERLLPGRGKGTADSGGGTSGEPAWSIRPMSKAA
jgi:peptidoglycan/LPS O-acetylase OafA/YrhL